MDLDEIKGLIEESGYRIKEINEIAHATQIKLINGSTINCYHSGKILIQGKKENKEEIENILGITSGKNFYEKKDKSIEKVFVVYGHNNESRDQLENLLRKWGLEPLILDQLPSEGQTIIEKLENYTDQADYGIVLVTPDDEGHRVGHPDEKAFRARQNVVLELGMLLSKLGRSKVAILLKNSPDMERPSDIQGLIYIPFNTNVADARVQLAQEMVKQGYRIDISKL